MEWILNLIFVCWFNSFDFIHSCTVCFFFGGKFPFLSSVAALLSFSFHFFLLRSFSQLPTLAIKDPREKLRFSCLPCEWSKRDLNWIFQFFFFLLSDFTHLRQRWWWSSVFTALFPSPPTVDFWARKLFTFSWEWPWMSSTFFSSSRRIKFSLCVNIVNITRNLIRTTKSPLLNSTWAGFGRFRDFRVRKIITKD